MSELAVVEKRDRLPCPVASVTRSRARRSLVVRLGLASCLAAFGVVLASGSAPGQCKDYDDYLHWVGGIDIPGVRGLAVSETCAYVASGFSSLQVIDITNPETPVILGGVDTPGGALDVAVSGHIACVADGSAGGLQVIDITSPAVPVILGGVDTPGSAHDVAVSGGYAYLADGSSGLQVIDISNPAVPVIVATLGGYTSGVAVSGNYAYVTGDPGFRVIDVTNPSAPVIVGSVGSPAYPRSVSVAGDYAYVTFHLGWTYSGGLQVIEVKNPANPVPLGSVITGDALEVAVSGSTAYVCNGGSPIGPGMGSLRAVDVTNPAAPAIVGTVTMGEDPWGVAVAGSYAYVADIFGLQVIDITDPAAPEIVGSADTPGCARGIAVAGSYAYVADLDCPDAGGLYVIDIMDPAAPAIVGGLPGNAADVAVSGGYAYVAEWRYGQKPGGLQVIDVTNPASPAIVGGVNTPGSTGAVAVAGSYAYLADGESGLLLVLDVTDPAAPGIVGGVSTFGYPSGLAVSGNYAYFLDQYSLQILPAQCQPWHGNPHPDLWWSRPGTPGASLAILPNPVRGTASIRFDLPEQNNVELAVYDVAGRRVRQLMHELQGTGSHVFSWDGTNEDNRAVPAGIYFIRLAGEGGAATERIVLLK